MKIETKYKLGDVLWFMEKNKVTSGILKAMDIRTLLNSYNMAETNISYTITNRDQYSKTPLFRTRQELIDSL